MRTLFKNIKELLQVRDKPISFVAGADMNILPTIKNAYVTFQDGIISDFGSMSNCPSSSFDILVDASGRMMLPSWCDSHTHIVYSGNRESEFSNRIRGLSYTDIAKNGGGILNSAKKLQETSEEELYQQSKVRLEEVIKLGTGAIEIKSGYGLTTESELKMLRVIKRLKEEYPIEIKSTFLAAHALPKAFENNKAKYLNTVIEELLPLVIQEKLAEYIDIFCETGYFSVEDTDLILKAGKKHGLIPKMHVNQFTAIGGVQKGIEYNALSVDHLEEMRNIDIDSLKNTNTMPVALPGCSFFLGISYTPARKMIDAGLPLALATDYNPGSAPSGNMNFIIAAACIKMKMTPEEAINAATVNGAYAMGLEKNIGSITIGKKANVLLTKPINSYTAIPYSFGHNQIDKIYLNGIEIS
ncbi:imidazolonepropionase [uncultured Algibacter sp.]|uniref:imidazolonepropionase n=1 Tax=uncultured Algibacter sp. TaxID=298659 RepID=UPI0026207C1F|nr:imidazolonepropionase [uncultured Algibacter sp.]